MILNPAARVRILSGAIIYCKALIIAQGLPEPSSLRGSTSVTEQLNLKA